MAEKTGTRKGIMLTLLVLILFILMLAEVITYVVVNSNYDQLAAYGTQAQEQSLSEFSFASGTTGFLHSSLSSALGVLVAYEAPGQFRQQHAINNTAYFLESLMKNGSVYGINFGSEMGHSSLDAYISGIVNQAAKQQINITVSNQSLVVYQGTAYEVNATYTALITSVTGAGTFVYPLEVSTSVLLNGTPDLYSTMAGSPELMTIEPNYPNATKLDGIAAKYSSLSPFMFTYGTLIYIGGAPTCADVPSQFQNANFILATPSVANLGSDDACGMGGLVTETPLGTFTPDVPYLVYANSVALNSIEFSYNGTGMLLSGPQAELLNMSPVQSAINNDYFYQDVFGTPYIDEPQAVTNFGIKTQSVPSLFSFSQLLQVAPYFNGASSILLPNTIGVSANFSVNLWFESQKPWTSAFNSVLLSSSQPSGDGVTISLCGIGSCLGSGSAGIEVQVGNGVTQAQPIYDDFDFLPNVWYDLSLTAATNTLALYVDGGAPGYAAGPSNSILANTIHQIRIGYGGGTTGFNGEIANLQIYNSTLDSAVVQGIYGSDVDSSPPPLSLQNVVAWLPLNGNANDTSGYGYNAVATNVNYQQIGGGSFADPIHMQAITQDQFRPGIIEALNCQNINQCSNLALPHLNAITIRLEESGTKTLNESATLGMPNAQMPRVLSFENGGYVSQSANIPWLDSGGQPYTFSIWIYPTSSSGVVIDQNAGGTYHITLLELVGGVPYVRTSAGGCTAMPSIPLGQWSNIVFGYDGSSTANAYLDGVQSWSDISASSPAPPVPADYSLGQQESGHCTGGTGAAFNGMMSDYQIYNSLLSPTDALDLYMNDSITTIPANMAWNLRDDNSNGFYNQTTSGSDHGNHLNFYTQGTGICSSANAVDFGCGVWETLP